jgi:hypothetical protein
MAETIQDTVDRLTAFINQNYTDIETGPGSVISELLIKLAATVHNQQYNYISSLSQANTISEALSSTEDTFLPTIDMLASNYNTVRSSGIKAKGKLKVTVANSYGIGIYQGTEFIQSSLGLSYFPVQNFTATPGVITTSDQLPLREDNGLYFFIMDVEAENPGVEYQISSGTVLAIKNTTDIVGFVKAEAYGNFSTGKSPETDKELIAKFKANLGSTRFESAIGIANRFSREFPGFQYLSVCGANDDEMKRSKQNALGLSTFGKADVYVRSSLGPEVKFFEKEARKTGPNTWEMLISNTDVPGFYQIKSITPVIPDVNVGGTLVFKLPEFDYAIYPGERNNEITNRIDARFTKYQTAKVTFNYSDTQGLAVDEKAVFNVQVTYQPNILEMQNMLLRDDYRIACADYLVKAVVPCMVSLKINIIKKRPTDNYESLNLQQLKKDLFKYINTIPIGQELQASNLIDICHNYDIRRVDLPIEMRGVIFSPDGSVIELEGDDTLTIPFELSRGVTSKTTAFFIDYYRLDSGIPHPIDNIGLNIA